MESHYLLIVISVNTQALRLVTIASSRTYADLTVTQL